MNGDPIFEPLAFRNLTVKNRIFRSSISGRWDNYDGSGTQTRINWEEKFARGGGGAVITSFVPVSIRGRILPQYAVNDHDDKIPFWRKVGEAVHRHDCKLIMQLSHSGRQQDIGGIENEFHRGMSSTNRKDSFHGLLSRAMGVEEIHTIIGQFAQAARRAREAGLDGVELHAANGYLFTQFLSSGINDRTDEYGGTLEKRAKFLLDVIRAIRKEVGDDFHLQVKINGVDHNNALFPWEKKGNPLEETVQICQWAEREGADGFHISSGSFFPHPRNPAGDFPLDVAVKWYDTMISSGVDAFRNFLMFRYKLLRPIFNCLWFRTRPKKSPVEGLNAGYATEIKKHVNVPVICTGGYQTASVVRKHLESGDFDGVTIARALIANNDLPHIWASGKDRPDRPCTYCNKCLLNVIENPLGCYELSRFDYDHGKMVAEVLSVFKPGAFDGETPAEKEAAAV